MDVLPACPATLVPAHGASRGELYAGRLEGDPASEMPRRRRRLRRWRYAAAADARLALGAAVIHLGYVAAAFAWVLDPDGHLLTWEDRRPLGMKGQVGRQPDVGASWSGGDDRIELGADGALSFGLAMSGQRVQARVGAGPSEPVTLVTGTPGGGWNVTEKSAGYAVEGTVRIGDGEHVLRDAGGWRDWTVGRQDARTCWSWAAGAGTVDGRRVGINVSRGMNGYGPGEDVVWWDGRPQPLEVTRFERSGPTWLLSGPGWSLVFSARGERAATERLGPVRSDYVQPIGSFRGTLPDPSGRLVAVDAMPGVTEAHEARW